MIYKTNRTRCENCDSVMDNIGCGKYYCSFCGFIINKGRKDRYTQVGDDGVGEDENGLKRVD